MEDASDMSVDMSMAVDNVSIQVSCYVFICAFCPCLCAVYSLFNLNGSYPTMDSCITVTHNMRVIFLFAYHLRTIGQRDDTIAPTRGRYDYVSWYAIIK